jgi:hypothetical protein
MSPLQVTLPPLVLLSNATFAVDGDMGPAFVLPDSVVCAIQEDMLLTIVHLHTFPLNRLPISTGPPLTQDRISPRGILIKLGVRWYEGGSVTIHLLHHHIYLFSFLRKTHLL